MLYRLASSKLGRLAGTDSSEWEEIEACIEISDHHFRQSRYFDSYCSLRQAMRAMQAKTGGSHMLIFIILLNLLSLKFSALTPEEQKQVDRASDLIAQYCSLSKALVRRADQTSISDRLTLCNELKALVARSSKKHLPCYFAALEGVLYCSVTPASTPSKPRATWRTSTCCSPRAESWPSTTRSPKTRRR